MKGTEFLSMDSRSKFIILDSSVGRATLRSHTEAIEVKKKYSSIAQSVERAAVNRVVVGSSPTRGA